MKYEIAATPKVLAKIINKPYMDLFMLEKGSPFKYCKLSKVR
ncbi:hypothetical protein GCM10009128_22590 [Psychrosphaera haliotis]